MGLLQQEPIPADLGGEIPDYETNVCTCNFERTLQYSCNLGEFLPSYRRLVVTTLSNCCTPLPSQPVSSGVLERHGRFESGLEYLGLGATSELSEMMQGSPVNASNPL